MLRTLFTWLARLAGLRRGAARTQKHRWPTREEIDLLPPFQRLGLEEIVLVDAPAAARRAHAALAAETVVGFDTESKPTFFKGQVSGGPHVVQFSTTARAYVFLLHDDACRSAAAALIALDSLKKVGFGLNQDLMQIRANLRIQPRGVVELQTVYMEKGHGRGVGLKVGVAIATKTKLAKSKKAGTSNWASRRLTDKQLLYAANDAYASLRAYLALTAS
jgi:ribonuclease D